MKQRSIPKMLLLFVVTLGFYRLYWLVKTRNELIRKTKIKIPSIWLYLLPYLIMIVSLIAFVVISISSADVRNTELKDCYAETSKSVRTCQIEIDESDSTPAETASFFAFYISVLFISPLIGWWYWKYAQAVEKVTKEKMTFPVAMLVILAVPDGFDMVIVQDSFNKLKEK